MYHLKGNEKLSQIRRTAAEILAAAVLEHDHKTFMIRGGELSWGFYFDFIFINPFFPEMLPYIEEKMHKIILDNLEIKVHEMIPSNGIELLRYHKQTYPAHFVRLCPDPFVQVVQIGPFVDHVHGVFLNKTGELKAFKLLKIEQRPDLYFRGNAKSVYRIIGVADESKEALKSFIKKYKYQVESHHLTIGETLGLFQTDLSRGKDYLETVKIYWKEKGESLFHRLHAFWRQEHLKEGCELIVTGNPQMTEAHQALYRLSKRNCENGPIRFAEFYFPRMDGECSPIEGLIGSKIYHQDCSHIFCLKKDLIGELNSSLIFLGKIPKMLELAYSLEISCPDGLIEFFDELPLETKIHPGKEARIQWRLFDNCGNSWEGPFLTLRREGKLFIIKRSFFSSIERLIGLVLETQEKDLSQKKELLDRMAPC